jgi:cysteine desulfurase
MDFFKDRIYLDYVSSTPLDTEMLATFPAVSAEALIANPSSLHKEGKLAKKALEQARAVAAETLYFHQEEIIFTANATESDNIAIQGTLRAFLKKGIAAEHIAILVTDSEHAAVLETAGALALDARIIIMPTDKGVLDEKLIVVPEGIHAMIVSVMYVNNEIGVVHDIAAIAKRIRFLRKHYPDVAIVLHTDATQAPLHFLLNMQKLGVDMMTLGATKLYCPNGVGLLYVKRDTSVMPILYGGGQEHGMRPGTPAVPLIHDFAYALQYAQKNLHSHSEKIQALQAMFEELVKKNIPQAVVTAEGTVRTPHISHIALQHFDSELLVLELDARGIAVSAKSACKNEEMNESDSVTRIYGKGWGAVRFSFGRMTTAAQIEKTIQALAAVLEKYRH